MSIFVKMFNTPTVTIENEIVSFPFKKAEALFYYLMVKGQATRDELVSLFWCETDEETARKNLRHAMYKIRKAFDKDIIISPQKSLVMLNPEIKISSDINDFIRNEGERSIASYTGEFLQGFNVKEGERFEEWMQFQRDYYKDLYGQKLYSYINTCMKNNETKLAEHYARMLINIDEFDENAYRVLMNIYAAEGNYNKIIDLYNKLSMILEEELGIAPADETRGLYEELLYERSKQINKKKSTELFFYGRQKELAILKNNYNSFRKDMPYRSILIEGEAGVGKTRLKDRFIDYVDDERTLLFRSNCYQAEENYFLKPWNDVFSRLKEVINKYDISIPAAWTNIIAHVFPMFSEEGNANGFNTIEKIDSFKYQIAEEAILGVLNKLASRWKILLIFDDIQWMDKMSITLLSNIIAHQRSRDIMLIAACRNGYGDRVEGYTSIMSKYNLIEKIELQRFTREEADEFALRLLPEYKWTSELHSQIFDETEGNAFFLIELLNTVKETGKPGALNQKAQDILKSRFIDISEECKKILSIISMFFDRISFKSLRSLSGKDELELVDILDELQGRMLLKEFAEDDISYEFTHQKLREFIYHQQSLGRRRLLHGKIAALLEQELHQDKRDRFIYPKLIYHFKNSGNKLSETSYRIKNLDLFFDLNHELFPIVSVEADGSSYFYLDNEEVDKQLNEIEDLMKALKIEKNSSDQIAALEMEFLHMKGRYLIREGEYETGTASILDMIQIALDCNDKRYAIKGYRQMVYYGIQTHNADIMDKYIHLGLQLAVDSQQHNEAALFLRLKGLNRIMVGEYYEAEEILKQAIGTFYSIDEKEDKYLLNIAACYNYIGEIRRHNMKFSSALDYYDRAIQICESKSITWGITVFYTNAGQAAFEMGDNHRASAYLRKALSLYVQMGTLWGRSTAEAYMTLINIRDGEYKKAAENIKRAEVFAEKLKSPYEIGVLYRVKAEVKANMKNNRILNNTFAPILNLSLQEYCTKGKYYLSKLLNPYEIDIINVLIKNNG